MFPQDINCSYTVSVLDPRTFDPAFLDDPRKIANHREEEIQVLAKLHWCTKSGE